uniref:Uncharacterized protein n=1 Tax=Ciona savignyi TaxID=51511 RepID=H2Z2K2_CIOSA
MASIPPEEWKSLLRRIHHHGNYNHVCCPLCPKPSQLHHCCRWNRSIQEPRTIPHRNQLVGPSPIQFKDH